MSSCAWIHVVPERVKTYAAPPAEAVNDATTAVSPSIATDTPNASSGAPPTSASACCWVHVAPERTKTYAAPS